MLIFDWLNWEYIFNLLYYFINKFYTNVRYIGINFNQISK